jgi:hypothetical protein
MLANITNIHSRTAYCVCFSTTVSVLTSCIRSMDSRGIWGQHKWTLLWWIYLKPKEILVCAFVCSSVGWNINTLALSCMCYACDVAFHGCPWWHAPRQLCRNWSRTEGSFMTLLTRSIRLLGIKFLLLFKYGISILQFNALVTPVENSM